MQDVLQRRTVNGWLVRRGLDDLRAYLSNVDNFVFDEKRYYLIVFVMSHESSETDMDKLGRELVAYLRTQGYTAGDVVVARPMFDLAGPT